jgi:hypothetical protein
MQRVHRHDTNVLATFDVRVHGQAVRALFDTGATCSCVTGFAKKQTHTLTPVAVKLSQA